MRYSILPFLFALCGVSRQDSEDTGADGFTFIWHQKHSLFLTVTNDSCYFYNYPDGHALTNATKGMVVGLIRAGPPGAVEASSLDQMRQQYGDLLADFRCLNKAVFTVTDPKTSTVACYVRQWSHYQPEPARFEPEDVDLALCTHLVFAFALPDAHGTDIQQADRWDDDGLYTKFTALKQQKPSLKVLLSVGGSSHNGHRFARTVSSEANMAAFARNSLTYLRRYGFDGLDVAWEYPRSQDKHKFTQLLQVLMGAFRQDQRTTGRSRPLLSVQVSIADWLFQDVYEFADIVGTADLVTLMTWDLHGFWDSGDGVNHHSKLQAASAGDTDAIEPLMEKVLATNVSRSSLLLSLSFYGRSYTLADPRSPTVGAAHTGAGEQGPYTDEEGLLAYYEVCGLLNRTDVTSGRVPGTHAPYVADGSRWTGYDDVTSLREKVRYARREGLGGVAVTYLDHDDFNGLCGGGRYPLLHAVHAQLRAPLLGR